jgi:hypothetical protein
MSDINEQLKGHSVILLPKNTKVTQKMVLELDNVLSFAPPEQLRYSLHKIFMLYLISEHDVLPGGFEDIASDFYFLVEFLTTAEKEMNKTHEQ